MTITDLFATVDISGLGTSVGGILTGLIAVNLLFLGYKYINRGFRGR